MPKTTGCWLCRYRRALLPDGTCYTCNNRLGRRGGAPQPSRLNAPLPAPTDALPGTEEKIKVLMERYERNEQLWHPADRRLPG